MVANERARTLETQLQELRSAIDPNGAGNIAGDMTTLIEARIKPIEDGLSQLRERFDGSLGHRLQTCEKKVDFIGSRMDQMLRDMVEDRLRFQDLHAEVHAMRQDMWWGQPSSAASSQQHSPKSNPEASKVEAFDLSVNDDPEGSKPQSEDSEKDHELKSLRFKDIHHYKVPTLPSDAGAYRQWKNSLRALVMSFDRSVDGAVMGLSKAMTAKSDVERDALKYSSDDFPRFDRILAAALCKPEHLRSLLGVRFNAYLEECELGGLEVRGRVMLNCVAQLLQSDRLIFYHFRGVT